LTNVRLADLLDAIVLVAEHPIRYNILADGSVVFSPNVSQNPEQLFMRTFRVDPKTFYHGLENISTQNVNSAITNYSGGIDIGDGGPDGSTYVTAKTSA
jgi:hypothetical protein